jgi:DHA1 family inner membrane transport protein
LSGAIVILICSIGLAGSMGLILSPVLPDIAAEFGTSVATIAWSMTAFGLGTALSALSLGYRLDRFGPARALQRAAILAGLAQIAAALATGWITLAAAEFVIGLAAGVILPAVYALAAEIAPKGKEAKTLGQVIMGWSLSLVMAVPLGAALAEIAGWRPMLAVVGIAAFALAPFPRRIAGRRKIAQDAVQMGRFGPLQVPGGLAAYAICFLFMASFYGLYAFAAPHAITDFGVSTARAGLVALTYGVAFGGASLLLAPSIDRIGRRRMQAVGFPLAVAVLAGLGLAPSEPVFLAAVAVWAVLNNLLVNTIIAGLMGLTPGARGAALGLYSGVTYIAAAFGTAVMGALFEGPGFVAIGGAAALMHAAIIALLPASRPSQGA